MSTSDDERGRDKRSDDKERGIAIPGYRPAGSQGPRHRPPSVQRSEPAGRVRTTGAHRAVRTTGAQRAVRTTGSQSAVRSTGPQRSARSSAPIERTSVPPRAAQSASGARSGSTTAPPRVSSVPSRKQATAPDPVGQRSGAMPKSGPRGIDELQAEMARDDIRLMARQIAQGGAVRSEPVAPAATDEDRFAGVIKWRPYVAAVLLVGAFVVGLVPILSTHSARSAHGKLVSAIQQAARTVGGAAGAGEVASWIGDRDLEALRTFYAEQRPRVISTLQGAGFEEIGPNDVTIRVDYDGATLIIGAKVSDGEDGMLVVAADLSGELVGRKPPPGGLGPAFDERGGLLLTLLAGAIAISGALWLVPMATQRRKG